MTWVLLAVVVVALAVVATPLRRRRRRREWEDLTRPGLPARRAQPSRGVGGLGEAPPTVHHRMGGRRSDD